MQDDSDFKDVADPEKIQARIDKLHSQILHLKKLKRAALLLKAEVKPPAASAT